MSEKHLVTIQKNNKLNDVFAVGAKGNGGAYHEYVIRNTPMCIEESLLTEVVKFQNGARDTLRSSHGILDTDLLEIVRHRLMCFQDGSYATRENEMALEHIEEALLWMNKRVEDRAERDVLGTEEI